MPDDEAILASLTEIAEPYRQLHYRLIRAHLEHNEPLVRVAREAGLPLRTAQRWVNRYRRLGLGRPGLHDLRGAAFVIHADSPCWALLYSLHPNAEQASTGGQQILQQHLADYL